MALGETLGRTRACGSELRIIGSEGERAPIGFGGGVGGGGVGNNGGGGNMCGAADARRGIGKGGWD